MARKIVRPFRNSQLRNTVRGREIGAIDYYTLISACLVSSTHRRIGWNHAELSFKDWLGQLEQKKIFVQDDHLEDALYAANLLDELQQFKHPNGCQFRQMLKRLLKPDEKFDRLINVIVKKDNK